MSDQYDGPALAAQIIKLQKEIERLLAELAEANERLHEVREIYAGMEGFCADTAPEAYLQRIVRQMYEAAKEKK